MRFVASKPSLRPDSKQPGVLHALVSPRAEQCRCKDFIQPHGAFASRGLKVHSYPLVWLGGWASSHPPKRLFLAVPTGSGVILLPFLLIVERAVGPSFPPRCRPGPRQVPQCPLGESAPCALGTRKHLTSLMFPSPCPCLSP